MAESFQEPPLRRDLSSEFSVRSLLISQLAMFILLCSFLVVGYSASLIVLHTFSGAELSELHQRLKSDKLFSDVLFASALGLSAAAAGWLAARTSNTRPLLHGALSSAAVFLLFLCVTMYDLFQFREIDLLWSRPLVNVPLLALPLFGVIGASILLLSRRMLGRKGSSHKSLVSIPDDLLGDLGPIAWKWLVRLIWLFSIVIFQILELYRYRQGETYRPFFGLYAAAIFALVIWFAASRLRDACQRIKARRQTRLHAS